MMRTTLKNVLITTLLGGSALVAPMKNGWAAIAVEAQSSWAISRVASISQGSYCTMAQKFGNNSVLSVARNMNGEYSLALDFQSPAFTANGEEAITLQPGKGEKQSFKAMPQDQQVVVVGLGNDENFFSQLDKSDSLKISYSGGELEYKLDNFKSGRGELSICLSGLNNKKASPSSGEAAAQEVAEKTASISPTVASQEPSVEGLLDARPTPSMGSEPISSTQTSVPVGKVEMAEPEAAPALEIAPKKEVVAEQKAVAVPTANPEQMRKLEELQLENAQLKRALTESRQAFENNQAEVQGAAVSELREKLTAAESENKSLKDQLSATKTQEPKDAGEMVKLQADSQRLTQQIESLKAENTTLRNQLEIASSATVAAPMGDGQEIEGYKNQLASLTSENQSLQMQLANARKAASQKVTAEDDNELQHQIRSLNTQLETLRGEKATLQTNYEQLQKESESGQLKTVGGNWDLEQATRRYQESQREIRRLGALLDDQRVKSTAEKKELEAMLFDPEIAKGAQIAKLNELQGQVREKETKIKEMEAAMTQLQAQVSPEKDQQIASLKTDLATVQKSLSEMTTAKTALESELAQSKAGQQEQGDLKNRVATLQDDVKARETKIKDMEAQLSAMQQASAVNTSSASEKEAQLISLQGQMAEKQAKITQLENQITSIQKESSATASSVAEKDSKIAQLQDELKKSAVSAEQVQLAKANTMSNEALVTTLKEELTTKSAKLGETEAQLAKANAQLAQLQAQSQIQSQGQSVQAASVANLQAQVLQGQQRVSQLEAQIKSMQQQQTAQQIPAQQAAYMQPSYGTEAATAQNKGIVFPSSADYESFLKAAGVAVKGSISEVQGGDPSSYKAYSWKTDSLYGSIEMRKADGPSAFDGVVSQYLARAKSRCNGEFAAVPSSVKVQGVEKSTSYEIACVGQGSSSSASILFTQQNGIVSTIAHKGRAEAMELAIDARDKIARSAR